MMTSVRMEQCKPPRSRIGRRRRHAVRIVVAVCVMMLALATVSAPRAEEMALAPAVTPDQLLADQYVLLANQALSGESTPQPGQFTQAAVLLDAATALSPDDAELWRFRANVAKQLGQVDVELAALTQYCRLVPNDDAALWRLIQLKLNGKSLQTVEQRALLVQRMLDASQGDGLTPALRSRLAAYLAAAAREAGDEATFASRLKQALRLDETNRAAARMLFDWVNDHASCTAIQRDAALLAMLRAAPTDAALRRVLAERLLGEGAYEQAVKQFEAMRMFERHQTDLLDRLLLARAWSSALAASGKVDEAVALLDHMDQSLKAIKATAARTGSDVSGVPDNLPEDIGLIYVAMLDFADRQSDGNAAFSKLRVALRQRGETGDQNAAADMAWAALLLNRNVELVPDLLVEAAEAPPAVLQRLAAWKALRDGDLGDARHRLEPLATTDPFSAYGMALSYRNSDKARQIEWLRRVASAAPGTLAGVLAAMDLHKLQQAVPAPGVAGHATLTNLSRWPKRLSEPDPEHATWTVVDLSVDYEAVNYLDPVIATISLRNAAQYDMAIADHGSLPSNVGIFITPRRNGKALGVMPPLVFDASRRLRLGDRESVRWTVRLDRGLLGSMLTTLPAESISFGVVLVADPWVTADGAVATGPTGSIDTLHAITRRGLAFTPENIALWLDEINEAENGADRMRAVARLMVFVALPDVDSSQATLQRQAADHINMLASQADVKQLIWLARFLAPPDNGVDLLASTRQVLVRAVDERVQIMLLSTQVAGPDDPLLTQALRDGGPILREFAAARRAVLTISQSLE